MRRLLLLFTLLLFSNFTINSQAKLIDSLLANARKQQNDSLVIETLHNDFFKFCYSQPEIARIISDSAISLSQKIKNNYLLSRALLRKGIYYDIAGKKDSSLVIYDEVIVIADKQNDLIAKASALNNKGLIYWNREEQEKAMDYYLQSLKIYKETGQERGQANNLNNIGLLLTELKRQREAREYHFKALKFRKKIKDTYGIGASYSNISQSFSRDREKDSAIYYSLKALKIKEKINDKRGLGITYNNLGQTYSIHKQYDSARYYLKKADKIYDELKNRRLKVTNISALASSYFDTGEHDQVIKYLERAVKLLPEEGEIYTRFKIHHTLARSYRRLNKYKKSSDNFAMAVFFKDSLAKQQEAVATQEIFEKYQSAEKERQILVQRAELAEQRLTIQNRNYQLYGLAGFALVLGLLGYLFYNQQKLKNKQLLKENELKDALIKIETQNRLQEQRLRISRDLHDNIGAQLTFIISSIDNLKYGFNIQDEKLANKLDSISDFTTDTIYELRDTIWAMNKDEISLEDLEARIANYIDKAKDLSDDKVQFKLHVDSAINEQVTFSSLKGMNVYRIIQEAIHNSLKYANASSIMVDVTKSTNKHVFTISDNGKGFDIKTIERGNGLNNMQKRASEINAQISINSSEGTGTKIVLAV